MKTKLSEHDIQNQILNWLKFKGIFHWRNNSGAMGGAHKGKRWFMRFGAVGSPDIFAIVNGTLWGIEVKSQGKNLTVAQMAFRDAMMQAGANYIMADSLDCVALVLES